MAYQLNPFEKVSTPEWDTNICVPENDGYIRLLGGTKELAIYYNICSGGLQYCPAAGGGGSGTGYGTLLANPIGSWKAITINKPLMAWRGSCDDYSPPNRTADYWWYVYGVNEDDSATLLANKESGFDWPWPGPFAGYTTIHVCWSDIAIIDRTNNVRYGPFFSGLAGNGAVRPAFTNPLTPWDTFYQGINPIFT